MSEANAPKENVGILDRSFEAFCKHFFLPLVPQWTTPNQITSTGFVAGLIAAASLYAAGRDARFYLAAVVGMFIYQICDTLDGTVARERNKRSTQGYFLDQMVDVVVTILVYLSIGFSGRAHLGIVLVPALLYPTHLVVVLHWINLKNRWPFPKIGPVEMYAILMALTLAMFFHSAPIANLLGQELTIFDCAGIAMIPFALLETITTAVRLFKELAPSS